VTFTSGLDALFNFKTYAKIETFEKCSILFKVKEGENSNRPDNPSGQASIPLVFRGLEFEPDAACPAISSRHSLSDGGSLRRPSSAVACYGGWNGGRLGKRGRFSMVSK
jgi:hypothetical protein